MQAVTTMANQKKQADQGISGDNATKDPDAWKTGDEPMTAAQRSYLHTPASEAAKRIEVLQQKTERGLDAQAS